MPTKSQLILVNNAAISEGRKYTIDPEILDLLPDDNKSYLPSGLLKDAGGWLFIFDLPSNQNVNLSVMDDERDTHGF